MTKTKRTACGVYEVSHDSLVVTITRRDDLKGWIAAANWDMHLYTDPVATKRAAVREAKVMIETDIKDQVR